MGKRGPASSFKPDYCNLARKFCILGATNENLAELFEVSVATISNWLRDFPEFKEAVTQGRTVADADVAESSTAAPSATTARPRASSSRRTARRR